MKTAIVLMSLISVSAFAHTPVKAPVYNCGPLKYAHSPTPAIGGPKYSVILNKSLVTLVRTPLNPNYKAERFTAKSIPAVRTLLKYTAEDINITVAMSTESKLDRVVTIEKASNRDWSATCIKE